MLRITAKAVQPEKGDLGLGWAWHNGPPLGVEGRRKGAREIL